jgi:hypothetical protein
MTQETLRSPTKSPVESAREPRDLTRAAELHATLPEGHEERFAGWGVMGVTFHSGDVLAMRRFPRSSIGEGYSSVWHRDPEGAWTIWADRPPLESCARYFGSALANTYTTKIDIDWEGPRHLRVRVPSANLSWETMFEETAATRAMNAMSRAMPEKAWRSPAVLGAMARLAGPMLHAGHLGLIGRTPNGQSFIANPMTIWVVRSAKASLDNREFGGAEPLAEQTKLGDFWIPQRGILAIGRSFFEPRD